MTILTRCRRMGLYVVESDRGPFVDVSPVKVDKGEALLALIKELGVGRPIIYLGDSEMDNPAFEQADVSIGVIHQESSLRLKSQYSLRCEDLAGFVAKLLATNLSFTPSMIAGHSTLDGFGPPPKGDSRLASIFCRRAADRFEETTYGRDSTPEFRHHLRHRQFWLVATYASPSKGEEPQPPAYDDFRIVAVARAI